MVDDVEKLNRIIEKTNIFGQKCYEEKISEPVVMNVPFTPDSERITTQEVEFKLENGTEIKFTLFNEEFIPNTEFKVMRWEKNTDLIVKCDNKTFRYNEFADATTVYYYPEFEKFNVAKLIEAVCAYDYYRKHFKDVLGKKNVNKMSEFQLECIKNKMEDAEIRFQNIIRQTVQFHKPINSVQLVLNEYFGTGKVDSLEIVEKAVNKILQDKEKKTIKSAQKDKKHSVILKMKAPFLRLSRNIQEIKMKKYYKKLDAKKEKEKTDKLIEEINEL